MSRKPREKFVPGEYYHVYSRTILNTPEFKDNTNAKKLVSNFLIANSPNSSEIFQYLRNNKTAPQNQILEMIQYKERLVDILCYCIMPDHYHLLLRERKENGIYNFIHKCNTAIAKYINVKKDRLGPLFESRFKTKHIDSNTYLIHLSIYIHLNPLDILSGKAWRNHSLQNWHLQKKKLLEYPWSSLKSFLLDNYNDPILSGIQVIANQFSHKNDYENFMREWSEESFSEIKNLTNE